jgi:hypothetical protein
MKKTVVTTKHSKPTAKLVPADKGTDDLFGFMACKGKTTGDVVAPAFSPEEWGDLYFPSRPRRPRR